MKNKSVNARIERSGFHIPRSVQQSIPIRRIYKDGIFEVGGKFSQTWKFTDINYSVAGSEAQEEMFKAYCAIIGLLLACPLSPIRTFVIDAAAKINFTAPFTMVGAYAGLAIGDQLKAFIKQGPKILVVGLLVMTGTFLGSCMWDSLILTLTGAI